MSEADLLDLRQNNKLKNVYSSRSRKDPSSGQNVIDDACAPLRIGIESKLAR